MKIYSEAALDATIEAVKAQFAEKGTVTEYCEWFNRIARKQLLLDQVNSRLSCLECLFDTEKYPNNARCDELFLKVSNKENLIKSKDLYKIAEELRIDLNDYKELKEDAPWDVKPPENDSEHNINTREISFFRLLCRLFKASTYDFVLWANRSLKKRQLLQAVVVELTNLIRFYDDVDKYNLTLEKIQRYRIDVSGIKGRIKSPDLCKIADKIGVKGFPDYLRESAWWDTPEPSPEPSEGSGSDSDE